MNQRFLIIDDTAEGRSLLTRTLLRKFPQFLATQCGNAATAVITAQTEKFDAILVHRTGELTGLELIPVLRTVAPGVPLVLISGVDCRAEALAAGAAAFLSYDAWLGLGTLVASLIEPKESDEAMRSSESATPFSQVSATTRL